MEGVFCFFIVKAIFRVIAFLLLLVTFHSCGTQKNLSNTNFQALTYAGSALGIRIEEHDNHALFLEAATWLGTPYLVGGATRSGVDCSGLTMTIYARIYNKQLHRRSVEQYEKDAQLKGRRQLQQGDLVFFRTANSGEQCGHVGIFLKDDKFIHAGSRGVVVESLESSYWQQFWLAGGCVR